MSLDIAVFDASGVPQRQIGIGVDDHHRLTQAFDASSPPLARMHDYYEDVDYTYEELEPLASEVVAVRARCPQDRASSPSLAICKS